MKLFARGHQGEASRELIRHCRERFIRFLCGLLQACPSSYTLEVPTLSFFFPWGHLSFVCAGDEFAGVKDQTMLIHLGGFTCISVVSLSGTPDDKSRQHTDGVGS